MALARELSKEDSRAGASISLDPAMRLMTVTGLGGTGKTEAVHSRRISTAIFGRRLIRESGSHLGY